MSYTAKLRLGLVVAAAVGLAVPARAQAAAEGAAGEGETQQLETITVVGEKPDLKDVLSPGVVSVVYPDDVKGEHKALPDLLDQIPGVYARRVAGTGQYTTASIRGSAPSQVNIYIDGVPYNTSSEAATDLSTIPMSNVERVEVYRGTTPARFSGAPLGGAINIVTKRPDQARTSVSAGARSFGGRQASGSVAAPLMGGAFLFGVDGEKSDGDFAYDKYMIKSLKSIVYSDGTTPADRDFLTGRPIDRKRQNNSFEKANAVAKWQNENLFGKWSYNDMERFMPEVVTLQESTWEDARGQPFITSQRRRQRVKEHNGAFGWRDTFGDATLGVTGTYLDQAKAYRNLDAFSALGVGALWSEFRTARYGIAADGGYEFGKDSALGHKLEIHAEHLRETMRADASNRISSAGVETDFLTRFRRDRTTIQAQDTITIRPLGDLRITPVARLERLDGPISGTRESPLGGADGAYGWEPTYGVSAKKRLFDGWEAFANAGTYNRYPSFYEIYGDGVYIAPNYDSDGKSEKLNPERGVNLDGGFGWTGSLVDDWRGSFRATVFQRRTKDAITLYSTPVKSYYMNTGTTLTRGLELEGNVAFGDRADLSLAGTLQNGRYVKGTYYLFGGMSVAERVAGKLKVLRNPDFSANARFNVHFLERALTTFAEVRHTGRVYVSQGLNGQSFEEPLTTFDAGANYRFKNGLKLTAGVIDMFDRGPKQRVSNLLIHPDPTDEKTTWDLRPNVYFPQQGRTLYATAAMTF